MYFQVVINYYICDGRCLSIKYHISTTVLYMRWGIVVLALLKIHLSFMFYCSLFKIMGIERQMFALIEKL